MLAFSFFLNSHMLSLLKSLGFHDSYMLLLQDLPEAVSADELTRYLDLKKLDERVSMYEAASAYDG